jgi:hypothetical protein
MSLLDQFIIPGNDAVVFKIFSTKTGEKMAFLNSKRSLIMQKN